MYYLIFLTVNTVKTLIVSLVNVTIGKNPRIKFLHNFFMLGVSCSNELVICNV